MGCPSGLFLLSAGLEVRNTNQNIAFRFTDAEVEIARATDLSDLLASLGYTIKRVGNCYTTKEMDSLRIWDRRRWYRFSSRQHGDAITFLQEFCGKTFPEAVNYLLAYHGRIRDSPQWSRAPPATKAVQSKERPAFALPPAYTDQRRVFAYLCKRGIASQVIQSFIDAGLLYEDAQYHNCVFVGRDGSGRPRFASKRGTYDLNGTGFKGDVTGSDKSVGFRLPCDPENEEVMVFESPIDLMSFCTIFPGMYSNAVALCGLYSGPLDTYLQENPHLKQITLLLDGDEPGIRAAKEMREKYKNEGYTVEIRVPKYGKDWNEQLLSKISESEKEMISLSKEEIPKQKEVNNPMANLGKIISDKTSADTQWREQRKSERENLAAFRDAGVTEITTDPTAFARYLEMQGNNPSYSAGNIAAVMAQLPEAAVVATAERWKSRGRHILDGEWEKGASIFARSQSGRGYIVDSVYDVSQTQGRELRSIALEDDTKEMEIALTALLNFSPVHVVADAELSADAFYDPKNMELVINPDASDTQAFIAIAAEIAHAHFHDRGRAFDYSREGCELSAQSVSCILCRRFGIQRELPDLSGLAERFQDWKTQDRLNFLAGIQNMSRQIGGFIEKTLTPPQRTGPFRHGEAR